MEDLVITLCRCFVTGEDETTYYNLFEYLQERIKSFTGRDIHWKHIHGDGWQVVTLDMDKGQIKGRNSQSTSQVISKYLHFTYRIGILPSGP